ncbi:nucleoside/nucleotide kinase family protein [Microlunatus ginsengisoli]|uniref:Nucleoside/nucleotide kinase family protein n=1 Tax=Microlunatus ginsengisoli TaxID=363863 RepID=A0ABP6ZSK2_9ACTN
MIAPQDDAAPTMADLIAAARALIVPGERRILGLTGAPGAGKSTLAEALLAALAPDAVVVAMDGFHLRDDELKRLGRYQRKGAIDTFDAAGFVHLLRRLRNRERLVYVPVFDRGLEESIGSAVPVSGDVPLIITEGNYLLVPDGEWGEIAGLLDESWYVEPGDGVRVERLIARHVAFGRSAEEAADRAAGSDGRNAELIAATRDRATRVVTVPPQPPGG